MSSRHKIQDASGVIAFSPPYGIVDVARAGVPTNGDAGYAKGCTYRNLSGSVGTLLYVNTGTTTSATWTNIA